MAKKIRVLDEGKMFESFVKQVMTINLNGYKTIIGIAIAGNVTATRAVHSALYGTQQVEIKDTITGKVEYLRISPSYRFRRIETFVETDRASVSHVFAMPRTAITADFQDLLSEKMAEEDPNFPQRVVLAKDGNIKEVAGHFLAETYGLPKKNAWVKAYLDLLPSRYVRDVEIESTDLADYPDMKAVVIESMKEDDVLECIQDAIQTGVLSVDSKMKMATEAVFREDMTTEDYLRENVDLIADKVRHHVNYLYSGDEILPYVGELNRTPVPAQARAAMGMNEVLKKQPAVFNVGDMGSGKTTMSLTATYLKARQREDSGAKTGMNVLIVAPANVCPKWASSEITAAFGTKKVIRRSIKEITQMDENGDLFPREKKILVSLIGNTEQALEYLKLVKTGWKVPKGMIHYLIVSTDRMKLSAQKFVLGARWNPYRGEWISPNTGEALIDPESGKKKETDDLTATWDKVVKEPKQPPTLDEIEEARQNGTLLPNGIPMGYIKKWDMVRSFEDDYTSKTDRSLCRPALKKWGEGRGKNRWMIAQIFQRSLKKHFHIGIFDEVHQMKSTESGRGAAFHKMLKATKKSIFLTGTLTTGESSSIFAILWRAFPRELIQAGFSHSTSKEAWARRYGVIEKTVTTKDGGNETGVSTNRKRDKTIVKEKPGITPELVSKHLLNKSIFVELPDLNIPLVQLEEKPVMVELDDDHKEMYNKLHTDMYHKCQYLQREIGSGAWAKFNPVTLNYADQPTLEVNVEWIKKDKYGNEEIIDSIIAPAFPPDYESAKERKLVELVEERLSQGRNCLVYNNFTGRDGNYKMNERIKKVLQQNGIHDIAVLDDRIDTDKRFTWLDKTVEEGTRVLITNSKLVEVGLDLMAFPTIIYMQMNDEISVVRQSSRRAWRIGQNQKCEILYLINDDTQQFNQFKRLMSKRVTAMITEGRIERSDDLAKYADSGAANMTNELSKSMDDHSLADDWKRAAEKDIDDDIEVIDESDFDIEITKRFKALAEETIHLSGYKEPTVDEEAIQDLNTDEMDLFASLDIDDIDALFEGVFDQDIQEVQEQESKKEDTPANTEDAPKRSDVKVFVAPHIPKEEPAGEQLSLFSF